MLSTRSAAPEPPPWGCFGPEIPSGIPIDPNGNLIQKTENGEVWDHVWNAENQLIRVCKDLTPPQECDSDGVAVASFKYDPLGRRIEKGGAFPATYLYNGWDIFRRDSSGSSTDFIHGPGFDEPLAGEGASGQRFYHADALGTIVRTTDAAGAVVTTFGYDPYGKPTQGAPDPYGFTGREWDPELEFYYYRARYYDPAAGRFAAEDPVRFNAGVNFYRYVNNNPVRFSDPSGLTIYECHRPMEFFGMKVKPVPHGFLWSTECQKSYSFGPKFPSVSAPGHIKDDDNPFDPDGNVKENFQCTVQPENGCVEDCVCEMIEEHKKNPPYYYTGPVAGGGNACTDQKDKVYMYCRTRCRNAPSPTPTPTPSPTPQG